jgi:hypothetical protein
MNAQRKSASSPAIETAKCSVTVIGIVLRRPNADPRAVLGVTLDPGKAASAKAESMDAGRIMSEDAKKRAG